MLMLLKIVMVEGCLDVSTKYKQNHSYFSNLRNNCYNIEVGEALFNYFLSIDTTHFSAQRDMPLTRNKIDAIIDNLPIEIQFLKEFVLFNGNEGNYSPDELYNEFLSYLAGIDYRRPAKKKNKFIRGLRENGINFETGRSRYNFYELKQKSIFEMFKKNNWIHTLDYEKIDKCKKDKKPKQVHKNEVYKFIDDEDDVKNAEDDKVKLELEGIKLKYFNEKVKSKILSYKLTALKSKQQSNLIMESYLEIYNQFNKLKDIQIQSTDEDSDEDMDGVDEIVLTNEVEKVEDFFKDDDIPSDDNAKIVNIQINNDIEEDSDDDDNESDDEKIELLVKNAAKTLLLCFD